MSHDQESVGVLYVLSQESVVIQGRRTTEANDDLMNRCWFRMTFTAEIFAYFNESITCGILPAAF